MSAMGPDTVANSRDEGIFALEWECPKCASTYTSPVPVRGVVHGCGKGQRRIELRKVKGS